MRSIGDFLALAVAAAPALAGCMQVTSGTIGMGASSGGQPLPDGGAPEGGTGTRCFTDPATAVVLCEQVAACPRVKIDPGVFPNCGFRLHAPSPVDLECLCNDARAALEVLCPIGVATNCDQAAQILAGQSALVVCLQQDEGRCVSLAASSGSAVGTCDKVCESACAGAPACIQLCGC
jgi:hypothetical protein